VVLLVFRFPYPSLFLSVVGFISVPPPESEAKPYVFTDSPIWTLKPCFSNKIRDNRLVSTLPPFPHYCSADAVSRLFCPPWRSKAKFSFPGFPRFTNVYERVTLFDDCWKTWYKGFEVYASVTMGVVFFASPRCEPPPLLSNVPPHLLMKPLTVTPPFFPPLYATPNQFWTTPSCFSFLLFISPLGSPFPRFFLESPI